MPKTYTVISGDGLTTTRVEARVVVPDSGSALTISGHVHAPGQSRVPLTGGGLTAPTAPTTSHLWWQVQADVITGECRIVSSTDGEPGLAVCGPRLPLLLGMQLKALPTPNDVPATADGVSRHVVILKQHMAPQSAGSGLLLGLQLMPQPVTPAQAGVIEIPSHY